MIMKHFLANCGMVISHPPYSPDLVPCESALKQEHFRILRISGIM
jgi:hypothetical protein